MKINKIKNKTTKLEKIALIWTIPIMAVVFAFLSALTITVYLMVKMLTLTGTLGASIYIFDQVKMIFIDRRLRKLVREDEKMYKFDSSKFKKDEDGTSTSD